jgi:hypothetical protein
MEACKQTPAGPFRSLRRSTREKQKLARVSSMSLLASQPEAPKLKSCFSSDNLSSMNGPPPRNSRKSVVFRNIEIREYEIDIGDNPSVRSGPPLSLGWKYEKEKIIALDEFETLRGPPRQRHEMIMPRNQREWLIRNSSATSAEIEDSIRDAHITQKGRCNTASSSDAKERTLEVLESAGRKFRRLVGGSKQKKREEALRWNTPNDSGKTDIALRQVYSMNDMTRIIPPQDENDSPFVSGMLGRQNTSMSCCDLKSATVSSESVDEEEDYCWGFGMDDDDDDDPVAF